MTDTHPHSPLWPGVPLALGSAVLFGAAAPFSKSLSGALDPFMLAGLLYLGAGLGLLGLRLLPFPRAREAELQRRDWPWLAAAIAAGGVAGPVLLMAGLARTSASNGALLLNLEGLATVGLAWVVFKENVDLRVLIGAFAILCGAALLAWGGDGAALDLGALLVAGASLAWGIDNNLTRKISAADPATIAIWKGCAAGSVNVGIALAAGSSLPPASKAIEAALVGFFCVGVSLVLFILALRQLGAARTGAYYSLAPFVGAALSIVALGEPLTAQLLVAGVLMGIGLWLHLIERHEHEHVHEAMEHNHVHTHDVHHQHGHGGPVEEPHSHVHRHARVSHAHVHYPDLHHRHRHQESG
ncbi:drug/metabolite transporter (DMT)-like permease [Roseiarcus fermentans]|uniref:Drug/metabolite transporter (DMT)-like permease n=1 Tax=Roseiarcus fermentans TaxID=1473586 RepID=A0A366FET5_9HYPH|nr:DMT family transporter [Roseiarcus fermentans]RBP13174.1 drug/metabolite transporter (DMT)-like permease [Roseiarcus fermentans]